MQYKSQICYSKRKYVHIKYTLSMESSNIYGIAKENMFICNILSACRQVTNMLQQKKICFISNIHSACRQVTNMLQQKKICSYLIYSQHVDKSQICYSKRKYVHILYTLSNESSHKYVIAKEICSYLIYSQHVDQSQICYSKRKYVHI